MNDLTLLAFLLLFALACFSLGVAWERNRNSGADRDVWQDGFERGHEKATKNIFRTAVRATVAQGNSDSARFHPGPTARALAAVARHSKLHDADTVVLDNDDDTVVLQFPQRQPEAA